MRFTPTPTATPDFGGTIIRVVGSNQSGGPGDIVFAGRADGRNTSNQTQTLSCARLAISNPGLFDTAFLSVNGGGRMKAVPAGSTRFCFSSIRLPPGAVATFEVFLRFTGAGGSSSQQLADLEITVNGERVRYSRLPAFFGRLSRR
jgi:hypothetical protein